MSDETPLQRVTLHGHSIAYRTAGDGPVVVLVHGMAGSSDTWRHVLPALARRFTVVAPDLLGHGETAKPRAEYSAQRARERPARSPGRARARARDVRRPVARRRYRDAARVSVPGALRAAGAGVERRPGREVSPLLRGLSIPGVEHLFPLVCSPALLTAGRRLTGWLATRSLRPSPVVEEIWRSYTSLADDDTRRAFFRTLRAVIDPSGQTVCATDRLYLASLLPTLIVWGARDSLIPMTHGLAAHEAIPGSRLAIFDDAGHFPHCEAPERFVETLVQFIDATEAARMPEQSWRDLLRRHISPDVPQLEGVQP